MLMLMLHMILMLNMMLMLIMRKKGETVRLVSSKVKQSQFYSGMSNLVLMLMLMMTKGEKVIFML